MTTVGLVLGAGGLLGNAFHAGALTALHDELGWDARSADLIIGTSAGSVTAAGLRAGLAPIDELARLTGSTPSEPGAALIGRVRTPLHLPDPSEARSSRTPASLKLAWQGIRNAQPTKLLSGLVAEGEVSSASLAARIREIHPEFWPGVPTWITAVEMGSGDRVVFGRSDDRVHLSAAVQASSAIPGYFAPVSLHGKHYIDGGTHSATNADLAKGLFFDLVVVSSTLSVSGAESALDRLRDVNGAWHSRTLAAEVEALRAAGSQVLVLEPTVDDREIGGTDNMDRERVRDYARQVRSSVRAQLSRPEVADAISLLEKAASVVP